MKIVDATPVEVGQVRQGVGGTPLVVVRRRFRRDGVTPTGYWDVLDHDWIIEAYQPWTSKELFLFRVLGTIDDQDLLARWGDTLRAKARAVVRHREATQP